LGRVAGRLKPRADEGGRNPKTHPQKTRMGHPAASSGKRRTPKTSVRGWGVLAGRVVHARRNPCTFHTCAIAPCNTSAINTCASVLFQGSYSRCSFHRCKAGFSQLLRLQHMRKKSCGWRGDSLECDGSLQLLRVKQLRSWIVCELRIAWEKRELAPALQGIADGGAGRWPIERGGTGEEKIAGLRGLGYRGRRWRDPGEKPQASKA